MHPFPVVPAKAGTQDFEFWMPAFAGKAVKKSEAVEARSRAHG